MEEGADNSDPSVGGSPDTAAIDAATATTAVAGFDFLDPRKPGYLARSRFKPSLRTRLPRLEGSHYPRPVWPRFSSLRRYVPVSALTAGVYAFIMRFIMFWWHLVCNETDMVLSWRTRIAAGVSLLGWFETVNVAFILWVLLDFVVALRDRRRPGLGQKVGYVGSLILLGALQFAYNRLDYAVDYLHILTIEDDQAHPSLMLRIPPEAEPDQNQPMTFEQCPVGLELLDADPNWGNMYGYIFFKWKTQGAYSFSRRGDPNLVVAMDMPYELRRQAATARPPWLLIDPTQRSDLSWRDLVELCDDAFKAGFERVFLRESKWGMQGWAGSGPPPRPGFKRGVFYRVAEVLPVQPTRWRQGGGREHEDKGLVRVWVCREGQLPWCCPRQRLYTSVPVPHELRLGPEEPSSPWYSIDHEGELPWWGPSEDERRMQEAVRQEIGWRREQGRTGLVLWIWSNKEEPYKQISPLVDLVSQKRWDPNAP